MWHYLLILCVVVVVQGCHVTTEIAAQRTFATDGAILATINAGHKYTPLTLNVVWQGDLASTFILPASHALIDTEVPDDWFDGAHTLTLERLFFNTRGQHRQWHVVTTNETLPGGLGILNLGPQSPLWLGHDAVVFTGNQLHFIARKVGEHCDAMRALRSVTHTTDFTLWLGSPIQHRLTVVDRAGYRVGTEEWNVTVHWGAQQGQTLIPPKAAAALSLEPRNVLMFDGKVALATGKDLARAQLIASYPNSQVLVFGRRLLLESSVGWAVDAAGHVALLLSDTADDAIPEAVYWIQMVVGLILVWVAVYWTSHLASSLQIAYTPSTTITAAPLAALEGEKVKEVQEAEGVVVTDRDLYIGVLVLALSILAHVLMGVYGSKGVLTDASLKQPLASFVLSQWIGSVFVFVVFFGLLLLEAVRRRRQSLTLVSIQLYAVGLGMVASRGVLAVLLLSAGETPIQLAVSILVALVFVYYPSVHATGILLVYTLAGRSLYIPHASQSIARRVLELFMLLLVSSMAILVAVTLPIWLMQPFLNLRNSLYSSTLIQCTSIVVDIIPLFVVGFTLAERGKDLFKK